MAGFLSGDSVFSASASRQREEVGAAAEVPPQAPPIPADAIRIGTASSLVRHPEGFVTPMYERVSRPRLSRFRTSSDVPRYSEGFDGNAILVDEAGTAPRSDYMIAVQSGYVTGGGCFPVAPDSTDCLMEPDSSGNLRAVMKEREVWTFRISYIDPSDPSIPERELTSRTLTWVARTSTGRSCFTFYTWYCNEYGIDLDEILDLYQGIQPDCSMKLGAGYRSQIFYQYSRYSITEADSLPPGTPIWEPATNPATPTRLAEPGKQIWIRNWKLGPGENALRVGPQSAIINPSVPLRYPDKLDLTMTNVGGATTTKIDPGETKLTAVATECGKVFPGVNFTGTIEHVEGSGGHRHGVSNDSTPPSGRVSDAPVTFSGTTDSNGKWTSPFTIKAGEFAGDYAIKAETADLGVEPGVAVPFQTESQLRVGFRGLWRLIPNAADGILMVGHDYASGTCETQNCDNHQNMNHNARLEMHDFVGGLAKVFRKTLNTTGLMGVNDMSLPFGGAFDIEGTWGTGSHITHRLGVDVDINRYIYFAAGAPQSLTPDEIDELTEEANLKIGARRINESSIHFRMPAVDIDALLSGGL